MSVTTEPVRITTLVENTAGLSGTLGEHGLSFWLETASWRVLFDTGAGTVLESNARALDVDLTQADAIVLSHGHYDHTGGLVVARQAAPCTKVFLHPAAFAPKYARMQDGANRYIGAPSEGMDAARQEDGVMISTNGPTEVADGLFVTGEIPRVTDFEDTGGPFFLDEDCEHPDPLVDDQALFFESPRGTVVVLGCAHAGVINTLHYIRRLTKDRPLHAVLGGLHLVSATEERIARTVEALRGFDIDHLGIAHCTGFEATGALLTGFPGKCRPCKVGTVMES